MRKWKRVEGAGGPRFRSALAEHEAALLHNLVTSLLAKTEFAVNRVVARVKDPRNEWLYTEAWGVDVAVSTPRVLAALAVGHCYHPDDTVAELWRVMSTGHSRYPVLDDDDEVVGAFKHRSQALTQDRVVVDEDQPDGFHVLTPSGRGMRATTRTPPMRER